MSKAIEVWGGLPVRVKMKQTVRSDIPFNSISPAYKGQIYEVTVNPHGAVAAVVDGDRDRSVTQPA